MTARTPEELHALVERAFNAADVDGFLALYREDATLVVPPDGAAVSGREAIREAIERTLALRPRAQMDVVGKLEADDLALTHGRWRLQGTDEDGNLVEMEGRGTMVSARQPDGSWRIVLDNPLTPS
jgi:uncharacterized protein (TIGR02246 family)